MRATINVYMTSATLIFLLLYFVPYTDSVARSLSWTDYYTHLHKTGTLYTNITLDIYKDMEMKYRHADLVTELHRGTLEYKLGSIAAALKIKFKLMLRLYRKYSNMRDLATMKYRSTEYVTAYATIDSIYNEIRVLRDIFWQTVKYQEKEEKDRKEKDLADLKKKVFEEFGINITSIDIDPDRYRLYKAYAEQLHKRDKKMLRGLKPPRVKGFDYLVKKFQKRDQARLKAAQDAEDKRIAESRDHI